MKELANFRAMAAILPDGAAAAEVEAEKHASQSVTLSGGHLSEASASVLTELFVRASGNKTGHAYSQDLEQKPTDLVTLALANSQLAATAGPEPMNTPLTAGCHYQEAELLPTEAELLHAKASELETALLTAEGGSSYCKVTLNETISTLGLVNTLGCDMSCSRRRFEAEVVIVQENGGHYILETAKSAPDLDSITADYFLDRLRLFRACQLPAFTWAAGVYPAVLDASVVCNIFATAWQMFTAANYLSSSTPLAGKLDQTIFPSQISIRDCPVLPGSGYQFPFDCEGTERQVTHLVGQGRLSGLLQTLATALQTGLPATGNAGRKTLLSGTIHTQVSAMPANFLLEPGDASLDELLAELGDGIYIHESYDVFHSINIASGAFSIPCKGVIIRKGQMAGLAENLTMTGDVSSLLASVKRIGSDVNILPMVMLKSYTVAAPSLLVSRLQVSGTK